MVSLLYGFHVVRISPSHQNKVDKKEPKTLEELRESDTENKETLSTEPFLRKRIAQGFLILSLFS